MTPEQLEALAAEMSTVIREHVEAATAPLIARLAAVEARKPEAGVGVAGAVIDRDGNLVLTLSDGTTRDLGLVVGKNGDPGKPGGDGFGLDDFKAEIGDDGRTVVLSFERGEVSRKADLRIPAMVYRGVFSPDAQYERGDTVTWAGSLWHCNEPTTDRPETSKAWTLAVKRGRDGKEVVRAVVPEHPIVKVS